VIPGEEHRGRELIRRLRQTGVAVLWLDHDGEVRVRSGAERVRVDGSTSIGTVIGRAAAAALNAAWLSQKVSPLRRGPAELELHGSVAAEVVPAHHGVPSLRGGR